jgi:hypothetical protein
MRFLLLVFSMLLACSSRHLVGYDHFNEVCVDGSTHFQMRLGASTLDCDSPPGPKGKLVVELKVPDPFELPFQLSVDALERVEWCPQDGEKCLAAVSGSLQIIAYEEGIAIGGPYEFVLEDDSRISGELAAQLCDMEVCT